MSTKNYGPSPHGPSIYQRDDDGLLENSEYQFNDDGTVDWRAMIKEEFLYPNHDWFKARGKTSPDSIAGLEDKQLLIMLGGIKELAQMRGMESCEFDVTHVEPFHVSCVCHINWRGNYESENMPVCSEGVASAHSKNTDDFGMRFLETIASNRAFVRCVRNFLNIHIVGGDEIDKSNSGGGSAGDSSPEENPNSTPTTPTGVLISTLVKKGIKDFDGFKEYLRALYKNGSYQNEEVKDWKSFDDVPAKEARKIIPLLHKK